MKKHSIGNFKKTALHLFISSCYLNTAMAQIVADYSAPPSQRPAILKGNNNQPVVNIQTPNNKGVSHNRYSQFDVDSKGVVLNNQRSNPHLAKGTAKVILNEVRSNKESQINGKIQVAGNQADVIIANPTGISINGANSQNIGHLVFTTGSPQFKNNEISNINVEKGKITVGKQGLNSNSSYTQLLGRAIEIQGKISADKLLVSAGGQLANYKTLTVQGKNGEAKSKPQIGIDTAALGGMYANHIHLVTNEFGVGVRNSGVISGNATLLIDSSGKIENKGTFQAKEKQIIRTKNSGVNGEILLQPNSKVSGSADTLISAGGRILVDRAVLSQIKNNQNPNAKFTLVGNGITFNSAKINTPNPLVLTTTNGGALKFETVYTNSTGKVSYILNEKQNRYNVLENEINKIKKNKDYINVRNEMNVLIQKHFGRKKPVHSEKESQLQKMSQLYKMIKPFEEKIKNLETEKSKLATMIAILNRGGHIQSPVFSEVNAGNITFNLAGGLDMQGVKMQSNQGITFNSYGSTNGKTISIQGKHILAESGSGDDYSYVSIYQPSVLSARNGITFNALQPNSNNSILIKGSRLNAGNGMVNIMGYGDVVLDYGKDEYYRYHKYSYKHGGKLNRKTTTVIKEQQHAYAVPTVISAQNGIHIVAGDNLDMYATELNTPKSKIYLATGKKMNFYAVDEQHKEHSESHTKKRFLGIKTNSNHQERNQILNEQLPVKLVAHSAHLKSGWDTLLQGTQFQTIAGAKIEAGVGEKARGDAKILLQGIKTTIQYEESKRKTGTVWQSFQNKGSIEEYLTLPTFTGGKPVFNASGGIVVDMPKGKLRNELEALLKKPEYAYLKNLKLNDNVQWKEVSLAYQQWDYKQQGLTGAGAAIIALAMAVVTAGAGATAVGLAASSAYAPIANAAFTALTTQATTSLVNNRGNLNQTFKDLGSSQQAKQFVTAVVSAGVADKLANTVNVNSGNLYLDKFSQNLIQAGSTAAVQAGINGGKFTKALENAIYTALIDTAHAELAKNIKGIKNQADANKWYREAAHKIAHAVAGCGAAAGRGGKCTDGALGAALGEVVGELLTKNKTRNEIDEIEVINKTKLIVGSVAAALGKDVNMSVAAAHIAVKFNTVNEKQAGTIVEFLDEMNNSRNKIGLKKGLDAEDALIKLSGFDLKKLQPNGVAYFNNKNARYIYTEKAGWIDMVHFLFYAGISYLHKKDLAANNLSSKRVIENTAINRAVAHGYVQEISDMVISKHSAFEYEDLVSDKQGAIFGAKYFDPKSNLNLGQQVKLYFEKELKAAQPKKAPNYHQLPAKDTGKHSGIKNYTTSPLFTK
ncbi:Hemagglutinin/hemolysin-related protein [Bibersteinia trehalosi USDA-ARS-USMARC-188]|uniref:Hemagglutinin/hemolysin-related protein n=2 Tax=Bibersteinia trehalosi TaxID=47735 RepID=A0A4V7IAJ4_BIBTR|nr:DUF637 domain-containing protein [Bibersteinia trehalosi]AGH38090.1 Hemagglutinin/hemolysin-related protein [Bibersteinia trehalosi USDA-ARS-USMARC-192]AHG82110.1 Hemagglutinin/hemolysin-related protein [Bibersteinia trehalosi USDA-ARS-USMARC-188]